MGLGFCAVYQAPHRTSAGPHRKLGNGWWGSGLRLDGAMVSVRQIDRQRPKVLVIGIQDMVQDSST